MIEAEAGIAMGPINLEKEPARIGPVTAQQGTYAANRIIALFPALLGPGGVQEAGRLTAAALLEIVEQNGWALDIFSLNDSPAEKSVRAGGRDIAMRGFGRAKMRFTIEAARQSKKNARIVLAAHPNLAVPATVLQSAGSNIKSVVITHGVDVWSVLPPLKRHALLRANLVLAPSRYTIEKLIEVQGIPSAKLRRLPWPLSPAFLRLADSSLPALPGLPAGRVILTVGRWAASERYKGCDKLIEAVDELRKSFSDLFLVVVGSGNDLPRLRNRASELAVADRVLFLENLSQEELASCYAHADIFALPSIGEGFGLVFLEAMAFAKPVVGVALGGPVDFVIDGTNGFLVPPHDPEELFQSLRRLLSHRELREQMGRRGAEIVRRKYDFPVFRSELASILAECGLRREIEVSK